MEDKFLKTNPENNQLELTQLGIYATHIQEVHSLMMATLLYNNSLNILSSEEIAAIFQYFHTSKVGDDYK